MTRGSIVVVTGLPAAGKSTLAEQLRDGLGLPLLSLDTVKEAVVDGLGDAAPEDRFPVRQAARDVVVRLAEANPRGSVIDVWVNPKVDNSRFTDNLRSLPGRRFAEVVCRVPADVAIHRYASRARHPAHLPMDEVTRQRILEAAPLVGPLGLGAHVDVDTTTPVAGERLADLLAWLVDHGAGRGADA